MSERITKMEMREVLRSAVTAAGGPREFCRRHDIPSHAAIVFMMQGRRDVSEAVANRLGYFHEITYRRDVRNHQQERDDA